VTDPIPEALQPRATFHERYEIVRVLKSGGMGTVYEVLDRKLGSQLALKTMHPNLARDAELRARFRFEALAANRVKSEHVVRIHDADVDKNSNLPFLVMEYLDGTDLQDILLRRERFSADDVVLYLWQAALALDRVHDALIVHRDLKPENLFLTRHDDGSPHIKILDFGVSKLIVQSSIVKTTRIVGTPTYMAPEQIDGNGDIDRRADIYALGHIAFTLLVGKSYWEPEVCAESGLRALWNQIVAGAPERATLRAQRLGVSLPVGFDEWFDRSTAIQPSRRFATAGELVSELGLALGVQLPLRDSRRPSSPPRQRRFVLIAGAGLALLVLTAIGTLAARRLLSTPLIQTDSSGSAPIVNSNASTQVRSMSSAAVEHAATGDSESTIISISGSATSLPTHYGQTKSNSPKVSHVAAGGVGQPHDIPPQYNPLDDR